MDAVTHKTDPDEPRSVALFKALAAFSRERLRIAGVDDLDNCHWNDVARMIRAAARGDIEPTDPAAVALSAAVEQGLSPPRIAAAVGRIAGAIKIQDELSVGAMTVQVLHEVARRRRLPSGRRWLKRRKGA